MRPRLLDLRAKTRGAGEEQPPAWVETQPIPPEDVERASRFVREQGWVDVEGTYPRGNDGTDGLEDGHWAVEA